ncbi:MAG: vanadium-dependent haloperoxidase [Acetobacteraceae bacterium]
MSVIQIVHHQGYPTPIVSQTSNGDETIVTPDGAKYIGNFHKTMRHNEFGEVVAADYDLLSQGLTASPGDAPGLIDQVPPGAQDSDQFVSPLAGQANERTLPHPTSVAMAPAPKIQLASTAAEMVELYWMALLRDVPFSEFKNNPRINQAIADIRTAFQAALDSDVNVDLGKLQLLTDLPATGGNKLDIRLETLFRCGLPGEDKGPIVSQFFLPTIHYGAQLIDQRVQPYRSAGGDLKKDFLVTYEDWLDAQIRGKDRKNQPYGTSRPELEKFVRPFLTMRDLATFVNQDALHQAYFNAALILDRNYKAGPGNPYPSERQKGFVCFGGPHLLSLVSEVAARALKVVWHQKWQVHRRARPEAYGGLVHMQEIGVGGAKRRYGLSPVVLGSDALALVRQQTGTSFLPMAFPQGSPTHPAYGAGHATVAGACVTILKAWFGQDGNSPAIKDPVDLVSTDEYMSLPCTDEKDSTFPFTGPIRKLPSYKGGDTLTVEGELNKLACNVAMGRSMGGVHWRSDNVRSLRLGEKIAVIYLARELADFIDRHPGGGAPYFTFQSFDRNRVVIMPGAVTINGESAYAEYL